MDTHTTIRKGADGRYRDVPQQELQEELPVTPRPVADTEPYIVQEDVRRADVEEPQMERELLVLRPVMFASHPMTFLIMWGMVVLGFIGMIGFWTMNAWYLGLACVVVACAAGVGLLGWWLRLQFINLKITEKRTIMRRGILSRQTNEVQHDDVRNLKVHQSFFQRLLGVGDLSISSSGQDDMEIVVRGIQKPNEAVEIIRRYQ